MTECQDGVLAGAYLDGWSDVLGVQLGLAQGVK